jgi:prepilin-type N-terminal cleavage/methylation domain-containing protein
MKGLTHYKSNGGFSFVELIIVIAILGMLAVLALSDFGFATNKARLQLSVEELVSLFDEAKVNSQAGFQQHVTESEGALCYGVWVGQVFEPALWTMPWDQDEEACDLSDVEKDLPLTWSPRVAMESMEWDVLTTANSSTPAGSLDQLLFLFEPPDGDLNLVDPESGKSLTDQGAYQVCAEFVYNRSDNPVMTKAVNVVPITSSFDILLSCEQ